jgi:hypothetical protein
MKKMLMILLAGLMTASVAFAQGSPEKGQALTYSQLANLLVKALGLVEYLPAGATVQQQFDILMQNGIAPAEGWTMDEDAAVTKGDLARVLVQSLQREDEVENPDNPQSWVDALAAMGISLTAASEALESVDALPEVVASDLGFTTTDPLATNVRTDDRPIHEEVEIVSQPVPVVQATRTVRRALSRAESSNSGRVNPPQPTPY